MKKQIRALAMMLCMAMLATGLPVEALASALESESLMEETLNEAEQTALQNDDAEELPMETLDVEAEPENDMPADDAEDAAGSVDYTADAGRSPTFEKGYAQILNGGAKLYAENTGDEAKAELGRDGVVYALERDAEADRLKVVFNAGEALEEGWMRAEDLRPIEPVAEAADYMRFCETEENVIYYEEYPLNAIAFSYIDMPEMGGETEDEAAADDGAEVPSLEQLMTSFALPADDEDTQEGGGAPATAAVEIRCATERVYLHVGETFDMAADDFIVMTPENDLSALTYSSSDGEVAAIEQTVITALKLGESRITVRLNEESAASFTLNVCAEAPTMNVSPEEMTLNVGDSAEISVMFPEGGYSAYSFESSDAETVSVDADGRVHAKKAGTATITAKTESGLTATSVIRVCGTAEAISFAESEIRLIVGSNREMSALVQLQPEGALNDIVYTTDHADVIEVDAQTGAVKGLAAGSATLIATSAADANVSASCTVTVLAEAESIYFSESSLKLGKGNSFDLTTILGTEPEDSYASYTFKSSNTKYVSVSAAGVIKGVKEGTATITATSHNGQKATIKVTVYKTPTKITVSPTNVILGEEQSGTLKVSFPSKSYSLYTLESDNTDVVTVDAAGKVTALQAGSATITATTIDGKKSASCTVTVLAAPENISASLTEYTMGEGMVSTALYGVYPEGTMCAFEYSSSAPEVVAVDEASGELTAVSQGQAAITITSKNSKKVTASCVVTVKPAPTSISFSAGTLKLGKGNTLNLNDLMQVEPEDTCANYTYKSSNTKYVSVNAAGVIKGVKEGTATITATSHNGQKATIKVTVYKTPTKITVSPTNVILGEEQSGTLKVSFPSKSYSLYTLESDNTDVVTVDAAGKVTALQAGSATITATTIDGKKSASCTVTVLAAPENISASLTEYTMGEGMVSTALYGVYPEGTMCAFEYSSSAPEVVSVDEASGELTAIAQGQATITITSKNSKKVTANCLVTVKPAPTSISFSAGTLKLGKGNTLNLNDLMQVEPEDTCANYTFKSSNTKYVSVNATGVIKGVKEGTATITATSHNGQKATIKVTVYKAPTKITVSPTNVILGEEQSGTLKVTFPSKSYSLYTLESSDENVVTVDAAGKVTALQAGSATITATTIDGKKSASCTVTVLAAPESISASLTEYTMGEGMVSTALYGVYPEGTMCAFEYSSSAPEVVAVDEATGELTAVAQGQATITITSKNSKRVTANCVVTVKPAPTSISFSASTLKLGKGNTLNLNDLMQVEPEDTCANYTFKSSNTKYVSVNAAGVIKGVKEGTATITATSHNGQKATIKVTVYKAPTKVTLTPASLTLGVGMSQQMKVTFPSKTYSLYTLESSDETVASVDAAGKVTALEAGSATITVKTIDGKKSASCTVTVKQAPEFVEFLLEEYEVSEGMKMQITPYIDPDAYTVFSFASSNLEVATIDENGVVTGLKAGTTKISVSTHNGVSNTQECILYVTPAPQYLDYNDMPTLVISVGDKVEIPEPIALDASGTMCEASYTFKSSNSKYVKVSGSYMTAVKAGTVTITATSHNGKQATFKVKAVSGKITGLELAYDDVTLYYNDEYTEFVYLYAQPSGSGVNYGSLTYTSSNPEVAYVSEEGLVFALTPGHAVITVTTFNGISASCNVTVAKLTTTLKLKENRTTITEGRSYQIETVMDEGASADLSYASSNAAIATVDENGRVTALRSGDVTITVKTQNELEAKLEMHIIPGPKDVFLDVTGLNLYVGEDVVLKPELKSDVAEYDGSLEYNSDAPEVAQVDADGRVTAISAGTATITVKTCNGHSAKCTVKVLDSGSAQAEFAWESATIVKGDTAQLQFTLNKAAYERGFTIESSNPEAVKVDNEKHTITAIQETTEGVKLTLSINPEESGLETLEPEVSCTVNVIAHTQAVFSQNLIELTTYNANNPDSSRAELTLTGLPENLIGTYAVYVEDEAIASYDAENGIVQASMENTGLTYVVCKTFDRTIKCSIIVDDTPVYRAVIIGEYNNSTQTGSNLPFAANNLSAMRTTLKNSTVDGIAYSEITYLTNNPSQSEIEAAIASTFADAKEGDVSLVYIVSHGYYTNDRGYYFGTPNWSWDKPDTVVTSSELMDCLVPIEGNVVLVLDSCRSGGFIRDEQGRLASEGNIAVITAQSYDKNASYYVTKAGYSVEFMTYAFCYGLGYQYDENKWLDPMPADGNGDDVVTIGEAISYAKIKTSSLVNEKKKYFSAGSKTGFLVPGVTTKAKLDAWGSQNPQTYIPASMNDVALYGRK